MLILPGSSQTESKTIRVDTSQGTHVENFQYFELSSFEMGQFSAFNKWLENTTERHPPTPRYNCHGMTFASRRTGIYEVDDIRLILEEDSYVEVDTSDILAGDVIIYFDEDGDPEHSGLVVEPPSNFGVPRVVSKWGKFSELIHWANRCPYTFGNVRYYRMKRL